MFVAINRFKIKPDSVEKFENLFSQTSAGLENQIGFIKNRLLKSHLVQPPHSEPCIEFLCYSEWTDKVSLELWNSKLNSGLLFEKLPKQALAAEPEFQHYELLLDEGPGTRVDCRSSTLDQIVENCFSEEMPAQKNIRSNSKNQGLPAINIGPLEGRTLEILLRSIGAQRGVEIGTLGGYSASWILRALSGEAGTEGFLHTLELDPQKVKIAQKNLESLGLTAGFEIHLGMAIQTLSTQLKDLKDLDFVFIDADKPTYPEYINWALPRIREGGLLIWDNAFIQGGMYFYGRNPTSEMAPASGKPFGFTLNRFQAMSKSWDIVSQCPDFCSIVLPTGEGLGVAIKKPKVWQK
jgi:predicted O-methyltransferase YrrM/heme-degrading monooxygenase HmoA